MLSGAKTVGSVKVLTVKVPGADANKLRQMGDVLRDKDASVAAVLASVNGEKLTFLAVCGKDAVKAGVKAGEIVKVAPGYARNMLLPQGLAAPVTEASKRRLAKLEAQRAAERKARKAAAEALAAKLTGAKIDIQPDSILD